MKGWDLLGQSTDAPQGGASLWYGHFLDFVREEMAVDWRHGEN